MVTSGEGRKQEIVFRYRSLDPDQRAIPVDKPLLLSANEDRTEDSGFYRVNLTGTAAPEKLLMLPKAVGQITKAKNADRLVVTLSRVRRVPGPVGHRHVVPRHQEGVGRQPAAVAIHLGQGRAHEVSQRRRQGAAGDPGKPENFDPAKKYPMMVYIYEELLAGPAQLSRAGAGHDHQRHLLRQQRLPRADAGHRLQHRLARPERREVRPAGRQDRRRDGLRRSEAIGIQGHSWGGYQIAYMITQTNMFAAVAGRRAGVEHDQRLRRHPLGHRACRARSSTRRRRAASARRCGRSRCSSSRTRRSSWSTR